MKRYCGYGSPTERRKRPCGDLERRQQKKSCSFFGAALFFGGKWSVERKEERLTGTARRNKGNDRRETAKLPVFLM